VPSVGFVNAARLVCARRLVRLPAFRPALDISSDLPDDQRSVVAREEDPSVRWEALFADLEARAEALAAAERAAEADERARIELASVRWRQRVLAALGTAVRLQVAGGLVLSGRIDRVGSDWLLMAEDTGHEALVSLAAVCTVAGLPRYAAAETGSPIESRLTLRSALRGIARDRSSVRMHLVDSAAGILHGTVDRVGADFVEVAEHPADEPRRPREVRASVLVPLTALGALRRAR
jgi:hypothetical protein